jgi:dUTP pyrophosphatase
MTRHFEKISREQWDKDTNNEDIESYNNILLPKRSTAFSAGYDFFSPIDFTLLPGQVIKIPTGIKVFTQPDEFLMIVPRSGLGFKYYIRLANTVGIIDHDYRFAENEGHVWIKIRNEGKTDELSVKQNSAIAQGIFQKYFLVDEDDYVGEQRKGGFGSTDVK